VESGEHIPTIPVLSRILAALDERLLIGMERKSPGKEPEREVAPAPEAIGARGLRPSTAGTQTS
jgi:hypothetical protein